MRKKINRRKPELLLDDIYNSTDPAVKRYIAQVMKEEVDKAQERALVRVAWKFKHLLSPRMQEILEAQHSRPESI